MVVMLVFVFVLIIVMMMAGALRIVAFVIVIIVMVVMMVMVLLPCRCGKACQLLLDGVAALHCRKQLLSVQLAPGGRHDNRRSVVLLQHGDRFVDFLLGRALGVRQHDTTGVLDLVIEEFAEILHIHPAFVDVHNRCKAVQNRSLRCHILHRANDV